MHTLTVLDPGHFHAALTLREAHPLLEREVHVYARPGPELEKFLAIVNSFNTRDTRPTGWQLKVWEGEAPLEQLIAERRGGMVVVAGRNDTKMAAIHRLHSEGFHVLADKPWVIESGAIPLLHEATTAPPLAMHNLT